MLKINIHLVSIFILSASSFLAAPLGVGVGALPYNAYIGMCHGIGYRVCEVLHLHPPCAVSRCLFFVFSLNRCHFLGLGLLLGYQFSFPSSLNRVRV